MVNHEHTHGKYCGIVELEKKTILQPNLPKEYIQPLAAIFKVLGDPTRLRILHALMEGEMCVCEIAEQIRMGQSAVSHQLRILRDARLVQFRRDGKVIWYSLADNHVFTLLAVGLEHVAE
ncbi:metalloregulator ArsR/SmtB family transcription factor [Megasphaera paucivorans]|uniref:DNA-binding transcriptional regulator, ArsR family n=1 Tax=Megasphaera paucivorans TaxID=349095 RepID=A0A1G9V4V4_9FIRM|nr:metalloregulator ArsR/SmtB family transcription factor [Megasphaera paucivorans]SDM67117.1 DNA-binding transcriptional regulator, ArsR family [Megasphaera paucivorans]